MMNIYSRRVLARFDRDPVLGRRVESSVGDTPRGSAVDGAKGVIDSLAETWRNRNETIRLLDSPIAHSINNTS